LPDKARRLNDLAIRRALELARIEFIDENGGGPRITPAQTPAEKALEALFWI
jgi:hypothetical protein